jgi:hypothetical protein
MFDNENQKNGIKLIAFGLETNVFRKSRMFQQRDTKKKRENYSRKIIMNK